MKIIKSRKTFITSIFIVAFFRSIYAETTTQISQYGITWTFATPVEFGNFVNGDYYVIDSGNGIQVVSVSPAPASGRNGSMINPVTGKQAYDNRISFYDASLSVSYPCTLSAGDSLVSSVSLTNSDQNNDGLYPNSWNRSKVSENHAALKTASVLTVLGSEPPPGSFRPPFLGTEKPLYNTSQIVSSYLPNIVAPVNVSNVDFYERGLQRPWLTHIYNWAARKLHPLENMRSYHRDVGKFLSTASLIMITDLATEQLVNSYIQTGIDQYYMGILGSGDSAYFEWQVIYTGLLLGDENMARVFVDGRNQTLGRASDKFYYWSEHSSNITSAIVPSGQTWTGSHVFFRKGTGNTEHEHLHPSEWEAADNGGGRKSETYRHCCDSIPHLGMFLSSMILGADNYWASQAPKDYLIRWMTEDWTNQFAPIVEQYWGSSPDDTKDIGSDLGNAMWEVYGTTELESLTLSEVNIINISSSSAVIEWKTNLSSTSIIEYGESSDYGQSVSENVLVNNHSITVNNLESDTEYHFRAKSINFTGNEINSEDFVFRTLILDTTAPNSNIVSPSNDEVLASQIQLIASATDNLDGSGLSDVKFLLDGDSIGTADRSQENVSTFILQWDTFTVQNGSYTLQAIATDLDGNQGVSNSISVTINNTIPDSVDDLIGYWNFDEISGNIASDVSGNGNNGNVNGASWTSGKSNNALSFPSGAHVDLNNINVFGDELTIAAWIKLNEIGNSDPRIISKASSTSANDIFWMLEIDDAIDDEAANRLGFRVSSESGYFRLTGGLITQNQWTYVVGVYDGTMMRLYQDGVEVASQAKTGDLKTGVADVWIGDNPTSGQRSFNGLIDEVRIYSRALNTIEINKFMDVNAPNLSDISVSEVSSVGAIVTWSTDENATSIVDYGITPNFGQTAIISDLTTSHSVEIIGLQEGTSYYYRVRSADISSNEAISESLTFTTTNSSSDSNLVAGLVGYWNFNETSGNIANDSSPNNRNGNVEGANWNPGVINNALSFNAEAEDKVNLGNFDVSGSMLTLAAWLNPSSVSTDARIISKAIGTGIDDVFWMLEIDDDTDGVPPLQHRLGFRINSGETYLRVTGGAVSIGQWTHVVGVYDGTMMRLYQDGILVASEAKNGLLKEGIADVWVGNNPPTGQRGFEGFIDEVRIYNRDLSVEEIVLLRDSTSPFAPTGLQIILEP